MANSVARAETTTNVESYLGTRSEVSGGGNVEFLADAHTDTTEQKLHIGPGHATGSGGRAPEQHAQRDQTATAARVGQAPEGNAADGVEQGKGQAHQQAHLGIADNQVAADGCGNRTLFRAD